MLMHTTILKWFLKGILCIPRWIKANGELSLLLAKIKLVFVKGYDKKPATQHQTPDLRMDIAFMLILYNT